LRNYKKERDWQLRKYDQIRANIDKELGTRLREKLKQENKTIASWVSENAKKYLEG
jgi:hypothetical protein